MKCNLCNAELRKSGSFWVSNNGFITCTVLTDDGQQQNHETAEPVAATQEPEYCPHLVDIKSKVCDACAEKQNSRKAMRELAENLAAPAVEPRLQEAKTLTQEEINRGTVCFGCETENICRSFKRCQIVRDAENNVAVEPQKREYCKNCGNRIYFDKSDVLGSRYRHHGSNFVDCHNGLQTVAEPEAGSTRPEHLYQTDYSRPYPGIHEANIPCGVCGVQRVDHWRPVEGTRPEMPPTSLWEVVPGKEQDDWGITEIDHAGSSIAQMMWQEDAEETVRLHNGAASVQQETGDKK